MKLWSYLRFGDNSMAGNANELKKILKREIQCGDEIYLLNSVTGIEKGSHVIDYFLTCTQHNYLKSNNILRNFLFKNFSMNSIKTRQISCICA